MSRAAVFAIALALGVVSAQPSIARAQGALPQEQLARRQTYLLLRRSPYQAMAWDLLAPGAGSLYTRLYGNTVVAAVVTLAGTALWIHGGVSDRDGTYWAGVGLFAAGRSYGIASAGLGARLMNRALRRHLRLTVAPGGFAVRF